MGHVMAAAVYELRLVIDHTSGSKTSPQTFFARIVQDHEGNARIFAWALEESLARLLEGKDVSLKRMGPQGIPSLLDGRATNWII